MRVARYMEASMTPSRLTFHHCVIVLCFVTRPSPFHFRAYYSVATNTSSSTILYVNVYASPEHNKFAQDKYCYY